MRVKVYINNELYCDIHCRRQDFVKDYVMGAIRKEHDSILIIDDQTGEMWLLPKNLYMNAVFQFVPEEDD